MVWLTYAVDRIRTVHDRMEVRPLGSRLHVTWGCSGEGMAQMGC